MKNSIKYNHLYFSIAKYFFKNFTHNLSDFVYDDNKKEEVVLAIREYVDDKDFIWILSPSHGVCIVSKSSLVRIIK